MLTFPDTDKNLEINEKLSKMITKKNYNIDLADLPDKNLMFEFAKEISFDEKVLCKKKHWDKSLMRLIKSSAIMAPGISTLILPENPNELYDFKITITKQTIITWEQFYDN